MLTPQPSPTPTSLLALAASLAADDGAGSGGPHPAPLAALQLSALVHTPVAVALPADALRELTERAGASGAAEAGAAEAGAAEAGAAEALLLRAVCVAHNKWATAEQLTQATTPPARPPARRCF